MPTLRYNDSIGAYSIIAGYCRSYYIGTCFEFNVHMYASLQKIMYHAGYLHVFTLDLDVTTGIAAISLDHFCSSLGTVRETRIA